MKNKSLIIVAALLVILIAAAGVLYPVLAEKAEEEQKTDSKNNIGVSFEKDVEDKPADDDKESGKPEKPSEDISADFSHIPDFTVSDSSGRPVRLSDHFGKPIVINFWATWCGYCIKEFPDFQEVFDAYGDDVVFLFVNISDSIEDGEEFLRDEGYTLPSYYDLEQSASIAYYVTGIPHTVAIASDGSIAYNRSGMIDKSTIDSIIEAIV